MHPLIRGIDMGQLLFKVFEFAISSGLLKFLKTAGIGIATFAVLNDLIQRALAIASTNFGAITGLAANALGLAGVDTALAIMSGAIIAHVFVRSQEMRFTGIPKK
ncbi:DUF2523 family protein [Acinetobacter cumulans]|nr:DUF2523 family protein [Acinetobacter cumulans]